LNYINVSASQYGVGSKLAAFHIAKCIYVMTHGVENKKLSKQVKELWLTVDEMEEQTKRGKSPYMRPIRTRDIGDIAKSSAAAAVDHPVLHKIISDERADASWTVMVLHDVRSPHFQESLRQKVFVNHLAYIYDHILHG
jgi:hypothetical protein